jgi:hypothetical protein
MKTNVFFFLVTVMMMTSCDPDTIKFKTTKTFELGEVRLEFFENIGQAPDKKVHIVVERGNLCGSDDVDVILAANNSVIFTDKMKFAKLDTIVEVPEKKEISILAKTINGNSGIQCVKLGNANCTIEY